MRWFPKRMPRLRLAAQSPLRSPQANLPGFLRISRVFAESRAETENSSGSSVRRKRLGTCQHCRFQSGDRESDCVLMPLTAFASPTTFIMCTTWDGFAARPWLQSTDFQTEPVDPMSLNYQAPMERTPSGVPLAGSPSRAGQYRHFPLSAPSLK